MESVWHSKESFYQRSKQDSHGNLVGEATNIDSSGWEYLFRWQVQSTNLAIFERKP